MRGEFYCCGVKAVVLTARTRNDGTVRTKDRWVLMHRWQCMVRKDHTGTYSETTDEEA